MGYELIQKGKDNGGLMAKEKLIFFCKECGYESPKWMGQCPGCKEWNTFSEAPKAVKSSRGHGKSLDSFGAAIKSESKPARINEIKTTKEDRYYTGIGELDRVLGGGIVMGSLTLVGGDPGIGKSTLLLQMCHELSKRNVRVLYVSGEESLKQIKMRADRIGEFGESLLLMSETCLDVVEEYMISGCEYNAGEKQAVPQVMIIDSIQTVYKESVEAAPGSVSQVRECTAAILRIAKQQGISVFVVGHVTKEGAIAGPRMLEHMVDTVLYFEGDNASSYRMLRAVKNRFGSTNELGVFEMKESGLEEVLNPSEYMLQGKPEGEPGSIVTCTMEGTRPIMVEIQALVCQTNFNYPRRTSVGVDINRITLLMAVIEKRLGIHLSDYDAYVNIAGGLRANEPALDLALVAAVLSSYRNRAIDDRMLIFGEVGLVGEVRGVAMAAKRIAEAHKMGYTTCVIPEANMNAVSDPQVKLVGIRNIRELGEFL